MLAWKDALALRNRQASLWRSSAYVTRWAEFHVKFFTRNPLMPSEFFCMDYGFDHEVTLLRSPVYSIDEDVLDVVQAAWPTWEPEPLLPTDFITPAGFLVLPRSFHIGPQVSAKDFDAKTLFEYWASHPWEYPDFDHLLIHWWPCSLEPDGSDSDGMIAVNHADADEPGDSVSVHVYGRQRGSGEPYLFFTTVMPFGVAIPDSDDQPGVRAWGMHVSHLQILQRLLQQRVFSTETRLKASKNSRRASKRQPVLVVSLPRQRSPGPHGTRTVEWSRRWWTNGHWRNQWYPSLQAHRQIWISGYVKGPEDKPFYTPPDRAFTV